MKLIESRPPKLRTLSHVGSLGGLTYEPAKRWQIDQSTLVSSLSSVESCPEAFFLPQPAEHRFAKGNKWKDGANNDKRVNQSY